MKMLEFLDYLVIITEIRNSFVTLSIIISQKQPIITQVLMKFMSHYLILLVLGILVGRITFLRSSIKCPDTVKFLSFCSLTLL
jgi:hypothetical protein